MLCYEYNYYTTQDDKMNVLTSSKKSSNSSSGGSLDNSACGRYNIPGNINGTTLDYICHKYTHCWKKFITEYPNWAFSV